MGKYILTGGLSGPWKKSKKTVVLNATLEIDESKTPPVEIIEMDITAEDLYNKILDGRTIVTNITIEEDSAVYNIVQISNIAASKVTAEGETKYSFNYLEESGEGVESYTTGLLDPDRNVSFVKK